MFLAGSLLFHAFIILSGITAGLWAHILLRVAPEKVLPFGQAWARLALGALRVLCGIRIAYEGLENIPDGPVILAAQHQSALDTMIWFTRLPKPAYVMKQELSRLPVLGPLLIPSGQIPLDRSGGAKALRELTERVRAAAAAGRQIIIFPEGTRVAPGTRGHLQPGIVAIARATGLPVIPISTDSGLCWGRNAIRKHPGTVHVRVHPPLPPELDRATMLGALENVYYPSTPCG
ncbi:lysophospholipid acyltransferase family protein [Acidiphilium sp.]|uniref:lysophospholipid acyltransferase family protein n=1 Tax=Acidiphilium sp. TaxID=527 RepID=UPI003CFC7B49